MGRSCSLRLDLDSLSGQMFWKLFHRTAGTNASIATPCSTEKIIDLHCQLEKFRAVVNRQNVADLHAWAASISSGIIPQLIQSEFDKADQGDILFVVSPQMAEFPFDFLISRGEFLCKRFRCGTIICSDGFLRTVTINTESEELLVLANQAPDLTMVSNETAAIRELGRSHKRTMRHLNDARKEKVFSCINQASIVHFAGHSFHTGDRTTSGWQTAPGELFDLCDMEHIGRSGKVPWLVFSNSCHAGNSGEDCELAGIAGALMKSGIPQVIGPVSRINDSDASNSALDFYRYLFKGKNPAEALLSMRKSLAGKVLAPYLYRLYGDPCFTPIRKDSVSDIAEQKTFQKKKKLSKKKQNVILIVLLVMLIILLFIPINNSGIMYVPAR